MLEKKRIAILAALLLACCTTTNPTTTVSALPDEDRPSEDVNATVDTSAIASMPGTRSPKIPLLAVEVEVTADGVKPLRANLILAPRIANSAVEDLRVEATGIQDWAYTFTDPRFVESDDPHAREANVLESARTYVYVPLSPALTTLSISPLRDRDTSRGGKFDVRELAKQLCSRMRKEFPICEEILAQQ